MKKDPSSSLSEFSLDIVSALLTLRTDFFVQHFAKCPIRLQLLQAFLYAGQLPLLCDPPQKYTVFKIIVATVMFVLISSIIRFETINLRRI